MQTRLSGLLGFHQGCWGSDRRGSALWNPTGASNADDGAIPLFAPSSPSDKIGGPFDALAHYAGESVSAATKVLPAVEIVREIAYGAETLLRDCLRDLGAA